VLAPLVEVRAASDAVGRPIRTGSEFAPRRFLPVEAALLVTDILADEAARAPAFGLDNALRLRFPVAVKTGTSRGHVDNWTVGFTRERTVAVWVGNFDGEPMREVSGVTGAGPLFKRVMLRAMQGVAPAPLVDPRPFVSVAICPLSGGRAGAVCPSAVDELFVRGAEPHDNCPMHRRLPPEATASRGRDRVLDVGPSYYAWARGEGLDGGPWPQARPATDAGDGSLGADAVERAKLLVPGDGDEYFVDPTQSLADQTIPVRAHAPAGVVALELRADDGKPRRLEAPFVTRLPARPGRHRLELWAPGAATPADVAFFVVR
jgi:penicillin-binding protein 1C